MTGPEDRWMTVVPLNLGEKTLHRIHCIYDRSRERQGLIHGLMILTSQRLVYVSSSGEFLWISLSFEDIESFNISGWPIKTGFFHEEYYHILRVWPKQAIVQSLMANYQTRQPNFLFHDLGDAHDATRRLRESIELFRQEFEARAERAYGNVRLISRRQEVNCPYCGHLFDIGVPERFSHAGRCHPWDGTPTVWPDGSEESGVACPSCNRQLHVVFSPS